MRFTWRSLAMSTLMLAAAACSETSITSLDELTPVEVDDAELQELMEASHWQIVERTGLDSTVADGEVSGEIYFLGSEPNLTINMVALPCRREMGAPIVWGDGDFTLGVSRDAPIVWNSDDSASGFRRVDIECDPSDDLDQFLGTGAVLIQVQVFDGGSVVVLDNGEHRLRLQPKGTEPTEAQLVMEARNWQIVERAGFSSPVVSGEASFSVEYGIPSISLTSLPCGRSGSRAIEWNNEGFRISRVPPYVPFGFGVDDIGCEPPDDLHGFINSGEIEVVLSDDGPVAYLRKGDRELTLNAGSSPRTPPSPTR